jgi:hypothetical protein
MQILVWCNHGPVSEKSCERVAGAGSRKRGVRSLLPGIDIAMGMSGPRLSRVWHDDTSKNGKRAEDYRLCPAIARRRSLGGLLAVHKPARRVKPLMRNSAVAPRSGKGFCWPTRLGAVPAQAGTHGNGLQWRHFLHAWIPAFAGMTPRKVRGCSFTLRVRGKNAKQVVLAVVSAPKAKATAGFRMMLRQRDYISESILPHNLERPFLEHFEDSR